MKTSKPLVAFVLLSWIGGAAASAQAYPAQMLPPYDGSPGPVGPTYSFSNQGHVTYGNRGEHTIYMPSIGYPNARTEATVRLEYGLSCDTHSMSYFPGMIAEVHDGTGTIRRVELLRFKLAADHSSSDGALVRRVQIGNWQNGGAVRIRWNQNPEPGACRVSWMRAEMDPIPFWDSEVNSDDAIAQRHAPAFGVRSNQCWDPMTDIPLQVRYRIEHRPDEGIRIVRYWVIFSDEDDTGFHGGWDTPPEARIHAYGRPGDTELYYEVRVGWNGEFVDAVYHTYEDYYMGYQNAGHTTRQFPGPFLPGTNHPQLSIYGDNNVLERAEKPVRLCHNGYVAHQPTPLPLATGAGVDPNPDLVWFTEDAWMHWVGQAELNREGRMPSWLQENLYLTFEAGYGIHYLNPFAETYAPRDSDWHLDHRFSSGRIAGFRIGMDNLDALEAGGGRGDLYWKTRDVPWEPYYLRAYVVWNWRFWRLIDEGGTITARPIDNRIVQDPSTGYFSWGGGYHGGSGSGGSSGGYDCANYGSDCGNGVCDNLCGGFEDMYNCPADCTDGQEAH